MPIRGLEQARAAFTDLFVACDQRDGALQRFTPAPRLTISFEIGRHSAHSNFSEGPEMRAEAEALTQSIKQSMGLLRRHL
jgi:hypothetical protein